jgi:hypothetical protein
MSEKRKKTLMCKKILFRRKRQEGRIEPFVGNRVYTEEYKTSQFYHLEVELPHI